MSLQLRTTKKDWFTSLTIWLSGILFFLPEIVLFISGLIDAKIVNDPLILNGLVKVTAIINLYLRVFKTNQVIKH